MAVAQKSHQSSKLSEPLSAATAALCADRFCYMHLCADRFCDTHLCDTGSEPLRVKQKMVSMCKLSSRTPTSPLQGSPELTPCKTQSTRGMSSSSSSVSLPTVDTTASPTVAPVAPSAAALSYYRRELPTDLVSFTSAAGRKLFKESLNEGYAEGYFNLAGNFTVQSEPAYCGPSSLAMVLNALEVDPGRTWKGVWRWYSDELLESCRTESDLKANGITFDQFLCLASSHAQVVAKRGAQASREEFLRDIMYVTQRDDVFMVLSFSRPVLGQTGDGHFSPIGAYHPESRMALVLDSARYKYPSWFGDVDTLYDSLQPVDSETGLPRGYFLISRLDSRLDLNLLESSLLASTSSRSEDTAGAVDLPERPSGAYPIKISCGKGSSSCCSAK
ncbi:hypothetical protein GGH94_003866 [Coemansia aciculifera]|uniref:glutathione gamma-glutamylcysteinyltransferase n=1 Tax=Coemansia aciculifera TaxID=417176 RepID=A0A9W8IGJ0_9FUNG|nr:hypothetical protein GGH94_003866 [Coemansia aciculifera]